MMHTNDKYEVVVTEDDMLNLIYQGKDVQHIVVEDPGWVEKYKKVSALFDIPTTLTYDVESKMDSKEYISDCVAEHNWHIPQEYIELDIHDWLIAKCKTDEERARVNFEYKEFEKRNMIPVLKFLMYFVDTMRNANLIWGVGRGSSVASYILYLMDIHKVDSLKYDIPINEFLK